MTTCLNRPSILWKSLSDRVVSNCSKIEEVIYIRAEEEATGRKKEFGRTVNKEKKELLMIGEQLNREVKN